MRLRILLPIVAILIGCTHTQAQQNQSGADRTNLQKAFTSAKLEFANFEKALQKMAARIIWPGGNLRVFLLSGHMAA